MGHMKATRQGIRSIKSKQDEEKIEVETVEEEENEEEELEPPRPHLERAINHQVVCAVIATSELKGTISTDLPGQFPFTSDLF